MGILTGNTIQLVIGEVGVLVSILVNPVGTPYPINLNTASSITLVVQYPDMITTVQLPMYSSSDGNSALRLTLATDFPQVGDYLLELIVAVGADLFKSTPQVLMVGGIL